MKASVYFFVVIVLFKFSPVVSGKSCEKILAFAINEIFNNFFVSNSPRIDLVFESSGKSEMVVDEILKIKNEAISVKVLKVNQINIQLQTSSLILLDSLKTFRSQNFTWSSDKRTRHQHLVYIADASFSDLKNIHDEFSMDNVNFLIATEKSIELLSSFMFTRTKCRSNQLQTINNFMKSKMRWEKSILYPQKYRNFFGCSLNISLAASDIRGPVKLFPNGSVDYRGHYIADILITLAKSFNFVEHFTVFKDSDDSFNISDIDLLTHVSLPVQDFQELTFSEPFVQTISSFAIPPGEPHSALQKMFLMFEFEVWIAISVTLLVAIVVIQVINLMPVQVQNFIFGHNIKTPMINLTANILTGIQNKLPRRNFARLLLIIFSLWCLVIRTCHQSKLFKNLQQDMRKPEVATFAEMVDRGFTVYALSARGISELVSEEDEHLQKK